MRRFGRQVRVAASAAMAISLSACATANKFADNADQYNVQAEKAQDGAILLNIIRASKRRPFEFAEIQTVTGSSPASGSISLGVPFAHGSGSSAASASPSLSLSNGPTVSMSLISTQDFYKGILEPIPMSTVDFFVQRGMSEELLFNLLFSKITFTRVSDTGEAPVSITAVNYASKDDDVGPFQLLVEALIDSHLTTTRDQPDPADVGPPMTRGDLVGKDLIEKAAGAGLAISEAGWCDLDRDDRSDLAKQAGKLTPEQGHRLDQACKTLNDADGAAAGGKDKGDGLQDQINTILDQAGLPRKYYRTQKADSATGAHFCFDEPAPTQKPAAPFPLCAKAHASGAARLSFSLPDGSESGPVLARINTGSAQPTLSSLCSVLAGLDHRRQLNLQCDQPGWNKGLTVTMAPRSVYDVIYYLGEVERRADDPDFNRRKRRLLIRQSAGIPVPDLGGCPQYALTPQPQPVPGDVVSGCRAIFPVMSSKDRPDAFLATPYQGRWYSIGNGKAGEQAYEVLDLVTELLALNRSAKDLPTSSVVTLLGAP